ncbi:ABC transporter ATP-binding protein [uncultured Phascolarctobacterium sp.]|uniref:ABC transporter ATP-binding protein n=1 Tax=uncultured Phascolarctobacterium sp. TaxID=512296 RepID=UPI0025E19FD2|nr:ABC transporter ATP-binding protein [uncultured Phascolarctobacterium sp.]
MFKTFLSYYKPYKGILLFVVIGSLLRALLELFFPYVVKLMLEQQLPLLNLPLLLKWSAALFVMYLANFGMHFSIIYWAQVMSSAMERDMRRDLFRHLQKLSFGFYDKNKSGQLLSRLTSDLGETAGLAGNAPNDIIVCGLTMLGTMVILVYMNPLLGSFIALLLVLKAVHTVLVNLRMKKAFFANRVAMGEVTAKAAESINGVRLIKAFAGERSDMAQFMEKADAYLATCKKSFKFKSYFIGSMIFFSNFINVAILVVGGLLINQGLMSFGELVAFFLYVGLFMKPLMQLLGFSEIYQRGMAGFKRFYELLQEKPEITDAPDAKSCPPCKGNITFDNVSFAYADGRPVIRGLSLDVAAGETVAFVGATGAGKTTIASLLLRFYEPQSGRILLDGCDIRELTQESLRRQIGLVQQDVFLFGDSVRYNIAYAKPDATADEVQAAAKAAAADEFIQKLPAGYDTEVGERGVKLSGGQKQRLAIARVFLKNPPVVVLDEATSALDNITEQQIQRELDELAVGRTTLIIAHRLSTIRHADKIVVLDEGSVVECGTHEELLARKGHYFALYSKQ